ncbi:hypothetical protein [Chroococcidiopsis sp. SAG 2025]|nr:hypothetical protein [Chroococcidiopsis sp. SAG 2025]
MPIEMNLRILAAHRAGVSKLCRKDSGMIRSKRSPCRYRVNDRDRL